MISVVLAYTCPSLLEHSLGFLQAQSYTDWEAVVIDTASARGHLAERYREPRIKRFSSVGAGFVAARNMGIRHAAGEYIAWLNEGDWWEDPDYLKRVLAVQQWRSGLLCSYAWMMREQTVGWERRAYTFDATPERLRRHNTLVPSGIVYPKSYHDDLGLCDETLGDYADWDWFLRVLDAAYPLINLSTKSVCHRSRVRKRSAEPVNTQFRAFCDKHRLVRASKTPYLMSAPA